MAIFRVALAPIERRKLPQEQAVGDGPAGDSKKTRGKLPGGISIEPPGFLKRIFSLPRNVRKTVSVNDVVVPVIGAREGWGRIRQVRGSQK